MIKNCKLHLSNLITITDFKLICYNKSNRMIQMKTATRQPIYILGALFILPLLIALILAFSGYRGNTVNKGQWITPHIPLNSLVDSAVSNTQYTWQAVFVCEKQCNLNRQLHAGLSTLGVKAELTQITQLSSTQLTSAGQSFFKTNQIYLADPQQNIIMSYPYDQVMDLVSDLKRLLKPIERRK